MVVDRETRKAAKKELERQQPLMDVAEMEKDFLSWLAELKFPVTPDAVSWQDCLKTFPSTEDEQNLESGRRIRLALQLHTTENQYVISIIENLEPSSRGTHTICVHVNWKLDEWQKQKTVESGYKGKFDDLPTARHTIWAQTFRPGGLISALNACAVAILGNELAGRSQTRTIGEHLQRPQAASIRFPSQTED